MKKALLIWLLLGSICGHTQVALETRNMQFVEIYDKKGRPLTSTAKNKINGSPHLSEEWSRGTVKFRNGRLLRDALLQFNIYSNQLHYRIDSIEFTFIDPVAEFSLVYLMKGQSHPGLFRSGYPGSPPLSENTFYEVLAEGPRYHLLKRNYKSVQDFFDYTAAPGKIYRYAADIYIYDVQTKVLRLTRNKTPLQELIPEQAEAIARITSSKNYRVHTEKELADLILKLE